MPGPLTSAATKRLRWIRQRPELPSWWTLLQVALGVGFFFYLAYSFITSGQSSAPPTAAGSSVGHGVVVTTTGGGNAAATATPSAAPSGTAGATAAPAAGSPATSTTSGGTETLFDLGGSPVQVPSAAAEVARQAMRAVFDPAARTGLPLAAGFTPPWASQTYPNPSVGPLTVMAHDATTAIFSAKVDPDGTQRFLAAQQVTVTLQHGTWVYAPTGG